MAFPRQNLALALLALYVTQVVSGRPLHLWQCCSAVNSSCCRGVHCQTSPNQRPHLHHHHVHCHDRARNAIDERQQESQPPKKNGKHDPSTCWICQVLGQAQDKPIEMGISGVLAMSPATEVVLPEFYPSPGRFGFHSRAPPLVQA